jgi:predicted O-methyltransferase YrrM
MEYEFTNNWFEPIPKIWEHLIPQLPARQRVLEIGAYEGRSTVWIMEHMLDEGGTVVCIDTWGGGEEHASVDMGAVRDRFNNNVAYAKSLFPSKGVTAIRGFSTDVLLSNVKQWSHEPAQFDFIYIDGSHKACDVLTDACLSWPALKKGGVMVFDDYLWGNPRDVLHRPKLAIDAFVNCMAEQLTPLYIGTQFVIKKL